MTSRWFTFTLVVLLLLIQYPLWIGKGGWIRGWELDRKRQEAISHTTRLEQRNAALDGEVRDLKQGLLAIEERARFELGMIRSDEVFVHVTDPKSAYKANPK